MAAAQVSWGRDKCRGEVIAWPEKGLARGTLIVGVGHRAQRGKDTIVAHLVRKYAETNVRVQRYSYTTALKVEAFDWLQGTWLAKRYGLIHDCVLPAPAIDIGTSGTTAKVDWIDRNKHHASIRSLLQRFGTEWRRAQDSDYWVNKTMAQITAEKPHVAMLADMRFPNEAAICDVTIRVERKGFALGGAAAVHASETELDSYPYDYELVAEDGDVAGLCAQAEVAFDKILLEHRVGF